MKNITLQELNDIICECMGEPNAVTEDALDNTFPEIGCDSLVILQMEARISQDFGVHIPELLFQKMTPRNAIAYVNQQAGATGFASQPSQGA